MVFHPTSLELLLWLSLLSVLAAMTGIILLPQNGPMKINLDRRRLVFFVEGAGLFFALIYAAFILGYIR